MMIDNIKKIIAILFLIPFINLGFILFFFEVYLNLNTLVILISFTLILSIDIIIRPISQRRDQYKYTKFSILLFLLLPLISTVPYLELKLLIQQYFIMWNNFSLFVLGFIILLIGGILLIYSRILLGKFASSKIVVEQNHILMTKGIYKYIRHPIYLGMLLVFFGYGLSFKACITPISFLIIFFMIFNNRMNLEEDILKQKFGKDYELYLERTKRLIPYIY